MEVWYLSLIVGLPLVGFILNGLLGGILERRAVFLIAPGVILAAFVLSVLAFLQLLWLGEGGLHQELFTWITAGNFQVKASLEVDRLSVLYLLVITGVGFLIHVYSVGYMRKEAGCARFFAYLNLFVFFMLLLVLANNLLLLFVGWEGVGLCSYLLIGYEHQREPAAAAAKKAFVVNRVGDVGFVVASLMVFKVFGSLDFAVVGEQAAGQLEANGLLVNTIVLLFLLGAAGKSAQIPLYVWLPDAMEGPTPVSALIHAATMVTAGLYLLARLHALLVLAPFAMGVIAAVGAATALFAATIALAQHDIKKVLAYSTVSQLGYMFMAMGVGAFGAAIFHVITHAFFKALLFLAAGSVIHALHHQQDMRQMGGLLRRMPITGGTYLVGALAISGFPLFFAGFFSKDEILWQSYISPLGGSLLWAVGALTAILTAFYMFRSVALTFFGQSRLKENTQVKESSKSMTVPLLVLAILSVCGGWISIPHFLGASLHLPNWLEGYFKGFFSSVGETHGSVSLEWLLSGVTTGSALAAMVVGWLLFSRWLPWAASAGVRLRLLAVLLQRKYYIDEIYDLLLVKPVYWISERLLWRGIDMRVVDGTVNGVGRGIRGLGGLLRHAQNGLAQTYLLAILLGTLLLVSLAWWKSF